MRPDDGDAFRHVLRLTQRRTDLPVVFGGQVRGETLQLLQFLGARTTAMRGLNVVPGAGLGGQVLARRRPVAVTDYRSADSITHDYDAAVAAEGIRSIVAVPLVVSGAVRGVLYGASRGTAPLGNQATDAIVEASRQLAEEIALRDEVDRRMEFQRVAETDRGLPVSRIAAEEVRELHAELRVIAQDISDDAVRERLLKASGRLVGLGTAPRTDDGSPLSPREVDVLAQVALGCSNAEVARRLSLLPDTVKTYLRNAMRKLDAHTRFEAVVTARRRGLLP
ncbi:LuxR C-terminal-related transcriptional regulator [Streptomyces sp. NPDC005799]|uniref:helix-turn-helix transcriptional regulator n=1 Tax=Streptomyces sp. NPDC005799 TaxID=3154678 RepID=UPI0033C0EB3A